jgi:hypothetical protein
MIDPFIICLYGWIAIRTAAPTANNMTCSHSFGDSIEIVSSAVSAPMVWQREITLLY